MSSIMERAELEGTIAEAGLSDEEAAVVWNAVQESGVPAAEAIALVLEAREGLTAGDDAGASGELGPEELAQLDKAKGSHLKRVRSIIGAELADQLEECPVCDGMGLAPPAGEAVEPKEHPYFRACETCNALGQVLTGSHVPGNALRSCPSCGGRGYQEALDDSGTPLAEGGIVAGAPAPTVAPPAPSSDGAVTAGGGQELRFGRPAWMGDPSLGQ